MMSGKIFGVPLVLIALAFFVSLGTYLVVNFLLAPIREDARLTRQLMQQHVSIKEEVVLTPTIEPTPTATPSPTVTFRQRVSSPSAN